jgi:hypothetical protein
VCLLLVGEAECAFTTESVCSKSLTCNALIHLCGHFSLANRLLYVHRIIGTIPSRRKDEWILLCSTDVARLLLAVLMIAVRIFEVGNSSY